MLEILGNFNIHNWFNSVHEKYYQKIVDSMELPSLTILDEMVTLQLWMLKLPNISNTLPQ
jgi:hypothetical protein